jgi:hypothetical protein
MASQERHRAKKKRPVEEVLPGMLTHALEEKEDFILTFETDPDTGTEHLYAMTGRFVSDCMLRKLIGQAESQRDEGSTLVRQRLSKKKTRP